MIYIYRYLFLTFKRRICWKKGISYLTSCQILFSLFKSHSYWLIWIWLSVGVHYFTQREVRLGLLKHKTAFQTFYEQTTRFSTYSFITHLGMIQIPSEFIVDRKLVYILVPLKDRCIIWSSSADDAWIWLCAVLPNAKYAVHIQFFWLSVTKQHILLVNLKNCIVKRHCHWGDIQVYHTTSKKNLTGGYIWLYSKEKQIW